MRVFSLHETQTQTALPLRPGFCVFDEFSQMVNLRNRTMGRDISGFQPFGLVWARYLGHCPGWYNAGLWPFGVVGIRGLGCSGANEPRPFSWGSGCSGLQKQISFGNDSQKSKGNGKGNYKADPSPRHPNDERPVVGAMA
jgi:hypothetical protein